MPGRTCRTHSSTPTRTVRTPPASRLTARGGWPTSRRSSDWAWKPWAPMPAPQPGSIRASLSYVYARCRQVRADPAAKSRAAATDRRDPHRVSLEDPRRLRQPGSRGGTGRTLMTAAEAVGITLAGLGIRRVFGVVGSGNFHVTNALVSGGARFVAARHEGGAATMADAYSRMSGTVAALSVHQGCGLTNAMTGIAEAAKSRTPLLVLAAEVTEKRSNFYVDQDGLADSVGAITMRVEAAEDAVATATRAYHLARDDRRTVMLNLPLAVQAAKTAEPTTVSAQPGRPQPAPDT